jgi:hypothetical protein
MRFVCLGMQAQVPLDFALVSTYVPLLVTIARALALTCAAHVPHALPGHVMSAGILFWAYMDAQANAAVHASHVAGHLLPVAFFLLTRATDAARTQEAWIAVDLAWAGACVALWASHAFRWRSRPAWAVTLASSAMALLHVYYGRDAVSLAEVCVRIVVFYVLCFVRYHALVCRVSCDAAAHAFVGPHVCLYVLFVQRYVLLCAVAATGGLACRLCAGDKKYSAWSERGDACKPPAYDPERCDTHKVQARPVYDAPAEGGEDRDLLAELRQAQACRV